MISLKNLKSKLTKKRLLISGAVLILLYASGICIRAYQIRKGSVTKEITSEQENALNVLLSQNYPEEYALLRPLPYSVKPFTLDVYAKSAIAVDVKSGSVLYEKDADRLIPPASMTKVFVMYVIFNEIKNGRASLDDVVPLPAECWASHMPPHSSLMFLGKNQVVTLRELMSGLAVASGNDAAYAIAIYLFGSMESFILKMNETVQSLGLAHTHFVEASGYSEKNVTTAREMASFARLYINEFPESLQYFHSLPGFSYPKEENLAPEDRNKSRTQDFTNGIPDHITMQIYQQNTNPLLGKLSGCDGLKTGYIDESGYNLALTVKRENMRVLSITMEGPGNNVNEGQTGRVHDGKTIMEWAFSTFKDYENPLLFRNYSVPLCFAKETRVNLVPAWKETALSVPVNAAEIPEEALKEVTVSIDCPSKLSGKIIQGKEYGAITFTLNGNVLETIPLVAEKDIKGASVITDLCDLFARLSLIF